VPVVATSNGPYGDMPYVIFPGNVGDADALVRVYRTLEGREG